MSSENDPETWKWLWSLASLPFAWLWFRTTAAVKLSHETRVILSERHYTKLEVQDLVDREVRHLSNALNRIEGKLDSLLMQRQKE